jgi:hypothetical protein
VNFSRNECKHFKQAHVAGFAIRRKCGFALCDSRKYCDVFGQSLTVIHFERGNVTLGIDLIERISGLCLPGLQVNANPVEGKTGLVHRDMVGEATRHPVNSKAS